MPRIVTRPAQAVLPVDPAYRVSAAGDANEAGSTRIFLPVDRLPARLSLNPDSPMSDDEYFDFCMANPNARIERTAQGEIIIVPPAGWESDDQCAEVIAQLRVWANRDG